MQKKNVLVLVEHFGQGGAERVAAMLAMMLQESGRFNISFYAVYQPEAVPVIDRIDTGSLGIKPSLSIAAKAFNYFKKIALLKTLKKRLQTDVTISSLWPVDWMNALTGGDKKIAVLQINVLNNPQNAAMVKYRRLVTAVYKRFDKVVTGASNLACELTDYFGISAGKVLVIHNFIDSETIQQNLLQEPPPKLAAVLAKYKVAVVANRLNAIKNTESLVPVYCRLSNQPCVKFLIIGEGEEKEKIQAAITQAGLRWSQVEDENFDESADFYFLNFQRNIHNIIGRSKVFLFPTKGEGLPLALLEAMYCGVPVLASDCPNGGVAETVGNPKAYNPQRPRTNPVAIDGGWLMPVPLAGTNKSITVWQEKVEEVLDAGSGYFKNAREFNRLQASKFDKPVIQMQWLKLLNEVLETK